MYSEKEGVVHIITNGVSAWLCAQTVLAAGGHPIMAEGALDIETMNRPDGLVINLGLLNEEKKRAIRMALRHEGLPAVLDLTGVHLSSYRMDFARELTRRHDFILKGNGAEIFSFFCLEEAHVGLEAIYHEDGGAKLRHISKISRQDVLMTGRENYWVSEGDIFVFEGVNPMLSEICGSGCALSALMGTYLAQSQGKKESAQGALSHMHYSALQVKALGPMAFLESWIDALFLARPQEVDAFSKERWRKFE